MSRLQALVASETRRSQLGTTALVLLALGAGLIIQWPAWAQSSYFLLTKSLARGTARIDSDQWQTGDKSWVNGHFYSVKAPGMPVMLVPPYLGLRAIGFDGVSSSYESGKKSSKPAAGPPAKRRAMAKLKKERLTIWALGIFGTVIPFLILLFLVRRDAEVVASGTGVATALTLGFGTMLLPFASHLFGHVLGALLLYLSFHLLFRERRTKPDLKLLALAGLSAGVAVDVEYPMAFGGLVLGIYAISTQAGVPFSLRTLVTRGLAFGSTLLAALVPLAIYNRLAFGSFSYMSYNAAVAVQGKSGHAKIGLNDSGFFGISIPDPTSFVDILASPRGLLSISPVCAIAVVGLLWVWRKGFRFEVLAVSAIVAIYLIYVSGYWLPFGGNSPGPRFLIPILPFIALGLAASFERMPLPTLGLAVVSASVMVVASLAGPLVAPGSVHSWWSHLLAGNSTASAGTLIGLPKGFWSASLIYLSWAAAVVCGAFSSRWEVNVSRSQLLLTAALIGGWAVLGLFISPALGEKKILPGAAATGLAWQLVVVGSGLALAAVGIVTVLTRRKQVATY